MLSERYWGSFIAAAALCLVLQLYSRDTSKVQPTAVNAKFSAFQNSYLFVFLLAMFADWLQGPYVYELYVSYGEFNN
jgi:hypothetical protein